MHAWTCAQSYAETCILFRIGQEALAIPMHNRFCGLYTAPLLILGRPSPSRIGSLVILNRLGAFVQNDFHLGCLVAILGCGLLHSVRRVYLCA